MSKGNIMMRSLKLKSDSVLGNQKGITLPLVAIMLFVFLGIAALALDLSHLYVVRNELQNAADAGALAGARFLYNEDGSVVNPGANLIAYNAARGNRAMAETGSAIAVDVNWSDGQNSGADIDVQRGHWSFSSHTFTANDSMFPVDLDRSTEDLDGDLTFINAVRVVARRQGNPEGTPAASFFARIFGYDNFELSMEAVAYIGYAGSLRPEDVDQPIAICRQSIVDSNGDYTCATGRMIDSGGGSTHNTAAWTNFTQEPCQTTSVPTVRPLICSDGNPNPLLFGEGMGSVGGMQNTVYDDLRDCWLNAPGLAQDERGYPTQPWSLTLPVIDCPGNNVGPCSELVGVVTLDVLWIKQSGTDPHWQDIPLQMEGWTYSGLIDNPDLTFDTMTEAQRQEAWQEFTEAFELRTADDTSVGELSASDIQKTMFFRPDCGYHEPRGRTGGNNFGVLARIPVLVQ